MAIHKKELLEAFKPAFKERGFTKTASTWVLEEPEVFCVFNVQTSQWSESYYFNAGIYVKAVAPRTRPTDPDCHWRTRLPLKKDTIRLSAELSDFENHIGTIPEKIEGLRRIILPDAFEWFSLNNSTEKLRCALSNRPKYVPPSTVALLNYLGLPYHQVKTPNKSASSNPHSPSAQGADGR